MDPVLISISQSSATKPERWAFRQSAGPERKGSGFGGIFSQSAKAWVGVWLCLPALKVS